MTEEAMNFDSTFNVEEEAKEDPLCPTGNYSGNTINVTFDSQRQSINWDVVLEDTDAMMSDGETPVTGQRYTYRNWLPRAGDDSIMTPSGRSTKRQAKINMLQQFAKGMNIEMNTPDAIAEGINEGLWIGLPVIIQISSSEYQGRVRNQVDTMVAN